MGGVRLGRAAKSCPASQRRSRLLGSRHCSEAALTIRCAWFCAERGRASLVLSCAFAESRSVTCYRLQLVG